MSLYSNNVSNNPLGLDGLITGQFDAVYINGVAISNGIPYTGASGPVDLNGQTLTNVGILQSKSLEVTGNSIINAQLDVGRPYQYFIEFWTDWENLDDPYFIPKNWFNIPTGWVNNGIYWLPAAPFPVGHTILISGFGNPYLDGKHVVQAYSQNLYQGGVNYNAVYVAKINMPWVRQINTSSLNPPGVFPEYAWAYDITDGTINATDINLLTDATINGKIIGKDTLAITNGISCNSLISTNATIGKSYALDSFLAFIDLPTQVTIHLIGDVVPFSIGNIITLTGSDTLSMNNTGYQVIEVMATTFIVTNVGSVAHGDYYPVGASMYLTNTGLLTVNDLSIVGTLTTSNIDSINVLAAKVTSPIYTTQTNSDLTILGKNGKSINLNINGTNVLQVTGTAIVPYQTITGYLTSVLASTTYLSLAQAALSYATISNPSFNGTISSSGVYISTSGTFWPPTLGTNGGQGDRLILKQSTGSTTYPYAIGLYTTSMWYSVPLSSNHIFYVNNNKTIDSSLANTYIYGSGSNVFNIAARGAASGAWMQFYNSMNTVYGLIGFDNNGGNNVFGAGNTGIANAMVVGTTGATPIVFGTNNASRMILSTSGNLGIGTLSPARTLHVQGSQYTSGGLYTDDWLRVQNNSNGVYWENLGWGIHGTDSGCTYGNVSTYGTGKNSWTGWDIAGRYTFMAYNGGTGDQGGIHDNQNSWLIHWDGGTGTNRYINLCKKTTIGSTSVPNYTLDVQGPMGVSWGDNSTCIYGPNSTWNASLRVGSGTSTLSANTPHVLSTDGNLHLDAGIGHALYLNYYCQTNPINSYGLWTHNGSGNVIAGQTTVSTGGLYITNNGGGTSHFPYWPNNQTYIRTNTCLDGNYLSIGTDSFLFPLWVNSVTNAYYFYMNYYLHQNGVGQANATANWSVSIYGQGAILTAQWFASVSDRRIKKNIKPVGSMLDIINKIEICEFDFIDNAVKRDECGVIAQQLETVFPNAVDTHVGHIPCYMCSATKTILEDGNIQLQFDVGDTPLDVGDSIKIISGKEDVEKSHDHIIKVLSIDGDKFTFKKWDNDICQDDYGVFVYGKQVDDYRNVDAPQLGILALKGVQELSNMVASQAETIKSLEANTTLLFKHMIDLTNQLNEITKNLKNVIV